MPRYSGAEAHCSAALALALLVLWKEETFHLGIVQISYEKGALQRFRVLLPCAGSLTVAGDGYKLLGEGAVLFLKVPENGYTSQSRVRCYF